MRVLLTTLGSGGDVHPFIALGLALGELGHEPILLTNPHFEPRIRAAGLPFLPLGEAYDYERIVADPRLTGTIRGPLFVLHQTTGPATHAALDALERAIDDTRPDVVAHHHLVFGADWVCSARQIPRAAVALAPLLWLSVSDPGVYPPLPFRPPPPLARARRVLERRISRVLIDRRINEAGRAHGYAPARDHFFRASLGGDLNLGLWSPAFRPPARDDPPQGRICGFCWFDNAAEPPDALASFLDEADAANDPPIVFTLGTAAVHHPGRYFRTAARAAELLGRRAVLLTGTHTDPPTDLPSNVHAAPYAPFSWLLPLCAAIVHHAGIGTTAQACRAACPALILPLANDEFDNAQRAKSLNVARTISRAGFTPSRVANKLDALLRDETIARDARTLADTLNRENGAHTAATQLETLATQGPHRDSGAAG